MNRDDIISPKIATSFSFTISFVCFTLYYDKKKDAIDRTKRGRVRKKKEEEEKERETRCVNIALYFIKETVHWLAFEPVL